MVSSIFKTSSGWLNIDHTNVFVSFPVYPDPFDCIASNLENQGHTNIFQCQLISSLTSFAPQFPSCIVMEHIHKSQNMDIYWSPLFCLKQAYNSIHHLFYCSNYSSFALFRLIPISFGYVSIFYF
jgi:hypothetical protein